MAIQQTLLSGGPKYVNITDLYILFVGSPIIYTLDSNGDANYNGIVIPDEWLLIGNSSDYEVYVTVISGTGSGGILIGSPTGTWLSLGSTQYWELDDLGSFGVFRVLNVKIKRASTGVELDSALITMQP